MNVKAGKACLRTFILKDRSWIDPSADRGYWKCEGKAPTAKRIL